MQMVRLTLNRMYAHHFQRNVIRFIFLYLPNFYNLIHKVVMDKQYLVSDDKYKSAMSLLLKHIIYSNQHRLPIQHMPNKLIPIILAKKPDQLVSGFIYVFGL